MWIIAAASMPLLALLGVALEAGIPPPCAPRRGDASYGVPLGTARDGR